MCTESNLFQKSIVQTLCDIPVTLGSHALSTSLNCDLPLQEPLDNVQPLNTEDVLEKHKLPEHKHLIEEFISLLGEAVHVRVASQAEVCHRCMPSFLAGAKPSCDHARVAVLFSGGIDSLVIAALTDR
jgi:asparagine synthetase B (glutamine-hydrolysing)